MKNSVFCCDDTECQYSCHAQPLDISVSKHSYQRKGHCELTRILGHNCSPHSSYCGGLVASFGPQYIVQYIYAKLFFGGGATYHITYVHIFFFFFFFFWGGATLTSLHHSASFFFFFFFLGGGGILEVEKTKDSKQLTSLVIDSFTPPVTLRMFPPAFSCMTSVSSTNVSDY